MKICFIAKESESLGIEYLSSFLKQHGHETFLAFDPSLFDDTAFTSRLLKKSFSFKEELVRDIISAGPDMICISVLSDSLGWAYEIAEAIKSHINIPVVFGGIHPSSVPEIVMENKNVDFVIIGEGEEALLDLVARLEKKSRDFLIPNLWFKKNGNIVGNPVRKLIGNLDEIPFPDKDLFYSIVPKIRKHYTIITSRGCLYNCTYCYNSVLKRLYGNQFIRRRTIGNVIEELKLAKENYNIKDVIFDDEIFTYDIKWLKEFSNIYKKEINLPCFLWVHPSHVNQEVVQCLKTMNCYAVEMGVQSINPNIRNDVLRRFYSNEQLKRAIRLLKKNRISLIADNIVSLPKERMRDIENLVRFYNETRPAKIYVFYLRFFPRTEIVEIANLEPGLIKQIEVNSDSIPFTLRGNNLSKRKLCLTNKLLFNLILINFLPRSVINFILVKRLYFYFPSFNPYNILETLPFICGFFRAPFKKLLPNRESRARYPIYMARKIYTIVFGVFRKLTFTRFSK